MNPNPDPFTAVRHGDLDALRRALLEDPAVAAARDASGVSLIQTALYHRRADMLEELLAARPALDIFEAAALGEGERLKALLAADPQLVSSYSADGWTPLHLASFFGRVGVAAELLGRGAPLNAVSRNDMANMPLHAAAAGRHFDVCQLLVESGADVNACQHGGWTALHAAAGAGDLRLAELLLAQGADPAIISADGESAKAMAERGGHAELADRLERAAPER